MAKKIHVSNKISLIYIWKVYFEFTFPYYIEATLILD